MRVEKSKYCPECVHWWFNRVDYGCTKGHPSFTSFNAPKHRGEICEDFRRTHKTKEYSAGR